MRTTTTMMITMIMTIQQNIFKNPLHFLDHLLRRMVSSLRIATLMMMGIHRQSLSASSSGSLIDEPPSSGAVWNTPLTKPGIVEDTMQDIHTHTASVFPRV